MQLRLLVISLWVEDTKKFPTSNSSEIFFQKNSHSHCWRARCWSKRVALVGCNCKFHKRKSTISFIRCSGPAENRFVEQPLSLTLMSSLLPIVLISMQLSSCYNCLYPQFHTFYFGRFKPADLRVRVGEYSFEHVIILERIYFTKHTAESMWTLQYLIHPRLFEEEQLCQQNVSLSSFKFRMVRKERQRMKRSKLLRRRFTRIGMKRLLRMTSPFSSLMALQPGLTLDCDTWLQYL